MFRAEPDQRVGAIQALGIMEMDLVTAVEIDQEGRLHVMPRTRTFPFAYREAMEVSWDPKRRSLHSPPPRGWSYAQWLQLIAALAAAQEVRLVFGTNTRWLNVPRDIQLELSRVAGQDA